MRNVGVQYSLNFSVKENEALERFLTDNDLPVMGESIKKIVLECILENRTEQRDTEKITDRINDWAQDNPELVQKIGQVSSDLAGKAFKKIFKK